MRKKEPGFDPWAVAVGARLRVLREAAHMGPGDLAKAAGVMRSTVYLWETGASRMTLESADMVTRALKADVMDLLDDHRDPEDRYWAAYKRGWNNCDIRHRAVRLPGKADQ